ncbi:MAG: DUF4912 domain-containing protein [Myxococcales bacterium]|nr:DUF4912 domain-containing protein [Myxococcales bacterium]
MTAPDAPSSPDPTPEAPAAFRTPALPDLDDRPMALGRDRVVSLPLAPDAALVFWELTADGFARAQSSLLAGSRARPVLRLYIDDGVRPTRRDEPVREWLGQQTVKLPVGARLVAALGVATDEAFAHVARSTAVRLPGPPPADAPIRFEGDVEPAPPKRVRLDDPGPFGGAW